MVQPIAVTILDVPPPPRLKTNNDYLRWYNTARFSSITNTASQCPDNETNPPVADPAVYFSGLASSASGRAIAHIIARHCWLATTPVQLANLHKTGPSTNTSLPRQTLKPLHQPYTRQQRAALHMVPLASCSRSRLWSWGMGRTRHPALKTRRKRHTVRGT